MSLKFSTSLIDVVLGHNHHTSLQKKEKCQILGLTLSPEDGVSGLNDIHPLV